MIKRKEGRPKVREQLASLEEKLTILLRHVEQGIQKNLQKLSEDPRELMRMLEQFEDSEQNWSAPKNLMCALLMEEVRQYSPMGVRLNVSSVYDSSPEAKRNTKAIRDWYRRI
jgi:hypothetical protein